MKLAVFVLCALFGIVTPEILWPLHCSLPHNNLLGGPHLIGFDQLPSDILGEIRRTKAVVVCATKQVVSGLRYKVQTTKCIMHFVELACVMRSLIPENCEEKARK
ncbi:uncharacterized protein LOC119646350 [Hermetia illucens]|uniref:uncharacterized protein LOC119646350 n=1 Tax=Hermetia illucens TaxID=343691 RepID=UPI0018CC6333|nr:uncharacterized protein LOC119646350 [Hermetia illucens]